MTKPTLLEMDFAYWGSDPKIRLRVALGIPPEDFLRGQDLKALRTRLGARGGGLPDGLARCGSELMALEYDHGSYKADQVRSKLLLGRALADRIAWGTPTARRVDWLREQGAECVHVVTVPL